MVTRIHSTATTDRVSPHEDPTAEPYDHHHARSSAATWFDPWDVSEFARQQKFDHLKKWNDGTRDSDRQKRECRADKLLWVGSFGSRLELPDHVVNEAKRIIVGFDVRRLGNHNGLYKAALGALVEGYKREWLRQGYRELDDAESSTPKRWCDREDFRRLWEGLGLAEDDVRAIARKINEKTDV